MDDGKQANNEETWQRGILFYKSQPNKAWDDGFPSLEDLQAKRRKGFPVPKYFPQKC